MNYYGKLRLNRIGFGLYRKVCRDGAEVTFSGRLFEMHEAATGNAHGPTTDSLVQTHSRTSILRHYKFCCNFCGPLPHPLPGDILPALTLFVACVALTRWVWSTECQSCLKATLNWSLASTRSFRLDTRSRWTRQATVSVSTTMDRGCQQLPDQPSRLLRPQCTLYATSLYMTI